MAGAREALSALRAQTPTVSVAGLSMGAAMAAILAAEDDSLASLVLIAPYLRIPFWLRIALPLRKLWGPFIGEVPARHPGSIRDPEERARSLAYGVVTANGMYELNKIATQARKALPQIRIPTLLIQSRLDPRVSQSTASRAMRGIGARRKRIAWIDEGGHVITVDLGREQVLAETLQWIETGGQPRESRLPGES